MFSQKKKEFLYVIYVFYDRFDWSYDKKKVA